MNSAAGIFTGEAFKHQRLLSRLALIASIGTLLVISFDVYQGHQLRKLTTALTKAQLDDFDKKNGTNYSGKTQKA